MAGGSRLSPFRARRAWAFGAPGRLPEGVRVVFIIGTRLAVCQKGFILRGSYGPLAQLVEQLTLNQVVPGSSPGRPTNPFSGSVASLQSPSLLEPVGPDGGWQSRALKGPARQ